MSEGRKPIEAGIAVLAVGLLVAGAVAVFVNSNGTGAAALLGAGTILVALVLLRERIETLRWGDLELGLRREADVAAASGDVDLAQNLLAAADGVRRRAAPVAGTYEAMRSSMTYGPTRTVALEAQMRQARTDARDRQFKAEELEDLFRKGSDGERIYALAALQEHPDLANSELVFDAIRGSRSRFEQYHALVLAERMEPSLLPEERRSLAQVLTEQLESGFISADGDRGLVANRILSKLE
jgi:hypothetical protein